MQERLQTSDQRMKETIERSAADLQERSETINALESELTSTRVCIHTRSSRIKYVVWM